MENFMSVGRREAGILEGTLASDEAGNPLVMHHGTLHGFAEFGETADIGFHFGTREQARKRLDTMPASARRGGDPSRARIVSAALAVRKPLLLLDDPMSWVPQYVGNVIGGLLGRRVPDGCSIADVRGWLLEDGYDAVCYRNMVEAARGARSLEFSWAVLDPAQVVILGEDVKAGRVRLPEGFTRVPGFDPHAVTRDIGGLRFRSGSLQFSADRKAFAAAIVAVMEEVAPQAEAKPCGWDVKSLGWEWQEGDAVLCAVMDPEDGKLRLEVRCVGGHDAVEGVLEDACCDGSTFGLYRGIRPADPKFWCSWIPGERLETAVGRCSRMLRDVAGRLSSAPALSL